MRSGRKGEMCRDREDELEKSPCREAGGRKETSRVREVSISTEFLCNAGTPERV